MTNSFLWVDQWLSDEGIDPDTFNMYQKKMFAELVVNGPKSYTDLKKKFNIARNTVHDRLKPFINIGWVTKKLLHEAAVGRPTVNFCSEYEMEE